MTSGAQVAHQAGLCPAAARARKFPPYGKDGKKRRIKPLSPYQPVVFIRARRRKGCFLSSVAILLINSVAGCPAVICRGELVKPSLSPQIMTVVVRRR